MFRAVLDHCLQDWKNLPKRSPGCG